jgi:hypothetical protein
VCLPAAAAAGGRDLLTASATQLPAATLSQAAPNGTAITALTQIKADTSPLGAYTSYTVVSRATISFTGTINNLTAWSASSFESALLNSPGSIQPARLAMSPFNYLYTFSATPPSNGQIVITYALRMPFKDSATTCSHQADDNNNGWLLDTATCGAAAALALFGSGNEGYFYWFGDGTTFGTLFQGASVTGVSIVPLSYSTGNAVNTTVAAGITLSGAIVAALQPAAAQQAIISTLATSLNVVDNSWNTQTNAWDTDYSAVAVTSIMSAAAGGRRLHVAAATVAFTVAAAGQLGAVDVSGSIGSLGADFVTALNTNLAAAGVAGVTVSGVSVTTAPTLTTTIASSPTPGSPPPSGSPPVMSAALRRWPFTVAFAAAAAAAVL